MPSKYGREFLRTILLWELKIRKRTHIQTKNHNLSNTIPSTLIQTQLQIFAYTLQNLLWNDRTYFPFTRPHTTYELSMLYQRVVCSASTFCVDRSIQVWPIAKNTLPFFDDAVGFKLFKLQTTNANAIMAKFQANWTKGSNTELTKGAKWQRKTVQTQKPEQRRIRSGKQKKNWHCLFKT